MADTRKPPAELGASRPLVPPLYQSSVYTLPDLDVLDRVTEGAEAGYIYARDGHPNARRLGDRLAGLEGAAWGLVTASGMAAISAALLLDATAIRCTLGNVAVSHWRHWFSASPLLYTIFTSSGGQLANWCE